MKVYDILKSIGNSNYFPYIYLMLFVVSSFFPIPFLTVAGAMIFPFKEVLIYSILGNIFLFTIMFYIARYLGKDYFEDYKNKHPKLEKIDVTFEKNSFLTIILLRFFFLIPPEFVNILGGVSEMKFKNYFIASFIGTLPLLVATILFVKSREFHSLSLFFFSLTILFLMLIIPLLFIPKLKFYLRKINCKLGRPSSVEL